MRKIPLFNAHELRPGEIRRVELEGLEPIAIYNLGGEFRATDDTCTHGAASLAEGDIVGDCIVCPYHRGSFDIRSGEARVEPCWAPLKTYPVEIQSGIVYLVIAVTG